MNRNGLVYFKNKLAGTIYETESGYGFTYNTEYLSTNNALSIAFEFPLKTATFESRILFPLFDGLIPEGWLLDIAEINWKINTKDRMGLLLACCQDCIGAVSVIDNTNNEKL